MGGKGLLSGLYRAALSAVDPERAVRRALTDRAIRGRLKEARRVGVFAVGKAASGMLNGIPSAVFEQALVVVPEGYPAGGRGVQVCVASHPEPDRSSVAAARSALRFFAAFGSGDVIVCLVSGGTSSLLCLPRPGVTLAEKRRRVRELSRSGASIDELNRLRTSLSRVKGGGLGRSTQATLITLVLSDVPGDRPELVGSGPTVRGGREDLVRVVGSNRMGLEAARDFARRRGLEPRVRARRLAGEAAEEGRRIGWSALKLPPGGVLLAGGETTVRLAPHAGHGRTGRGGRTLEIALGAAEALDGNSAALLAAGSDGRDGSSRAAGAFADGSTLERARRRGLSAGRSLARHDTEPFFDALGDLLITGPTGTNVCDWVFAIGPKTLI
ncbi:MAG: DUF4147 domain-containing protein [Acidobacteriota bacterium]|nr:DUF4147 domain-containing protein [Acidobacteriota bacterium]